MMTFLWVLAVIVIAVFDLLGVFFALIMGIPLFVAWRSDRAEKAKMMAKANRG